MIIELSVDHPVPDLLVRAFNMRFPTVALALAGIASTVQGFWMGDIAREALSCT